MRARTPIPALLAGPCLAMLAGCSPPASSLSYLGRATAQLELAPTGVGCVVIQVVGVATVTQQFDVAPQGDTVFALDGLPLGSDTFTAKAYSVACSNSATATASYVSSSVVATVTVDMPVRVALDMSSGTGEGTVGVVFPAGTLAPVGVGCIVVQAAGTTSVTDPFDVAPESDTVFALVALPLGSDTFTAQAFSGPCIQTGTTSAAWASAGVTASISAATPASVTLLMVQQAPSNLAYSTNPAVYTVGTAITPNVPSSSGGPVASYSVLPALPASLSLNPTTGIISGTPTTTVMASLFVVKATNSAGSATASLSITINSASAGEETVRVEFPPTITEFQLSANALPLGIAAGPDGNLWFTESGTTANSIGRITTSGTITEFPIPTASSFARAITAGPDNNLWFTEDSVGKIGRITTLGTITEFPIPDITYQGNLSPLNPFGIAAGPDGNLWFTGTRVNSPFADVGRITTAGAITQFQLGYVRPEGIVAGPDGNLWFTEYAANNIGRITPGGTITEYSGANSPTSITVGPDGNLWFGEYNDIGVITTGGTLTTLYPDCSACQVNGIVSASDGNLWFTDFGAGDVGSITTSGTITKFPTTPFDPYGIAVGPDGNLWFTEYAANNIGRITLPSVVAPAGVACIVVQVTPSLASTVSYPFDVGPGSSTVFILTGVPLGSAFFVAQAFAVPCVQTGGASATYASTGVTANVTGGVPGSVSLLLVAE